MSILDPFFRKLSLNTSYEHRAEWLKKISDPDKAYSVVRERANASLQHLKHQLDSGESTVLNDMDPTFKEIYAHHRCYGLIDGLIELYSDDDDFQAEALALLGENGEHVHWLVQFDYNGKRYFSDAYGVFDSLDKIIDRYVNTTVAKAVAFDHTDDADPMYQPLRDLTVDVFDNFEGAIFELKGEMDVDEVVSYMELFELGEAASTLPQGRTRQLANEQSLSL